MSLKEKAITGTTQNATKNLVVAQSPSAKIEGDLKPLEDRLLRIKQLWQIQGKHQRLIDSRERLKRFLAEVEKDNLQITIKNNDYSSREEFTTKNIAVISEILDCLLNSIDKKILELEPLLTW